MVNAEAYQKRGSTGLRIPLFVAFEAVIFGIFVLFEVVVNLETYYIYLFGLPTLMAVIILLDSRLRQSAADSFMSVDFLFLAGTIAFWYLIYGGFGFGRGQVLLTLYAPVILEEVNFRFILMEYIGRKMTMEKAVLIQGLLFGIWYLYYELIYQGTYPDIFLSITFFLSMITIGIIYGAIYYVRKNVYIPMALHLSLLLMVLPISPWWLNLISYLMGPT